MKKIYKIKYEVIDSHNTLSYTLTTSVLAESEKEAIEKISRGVKDSQNYIINVLKIKVN
jgi:hypothetical protein